jgi:23S rRNA pseudouridine1911/1915/1917 synthase
MKKWTSDAGSPGDLVLYRSNAFWICQKPAGMPVQPDASGDKSLLDLIGIYGKRRFFPVHRLDRPVSGLVIFARNANAAAQLSAAFRQRAVHKVYLAVTDQAPTPEEGVWQHRLYTDKKKRKALLVSPPLEDGTDCVLHYRLLGSSERYHLLELQPEGGHFHQIRAQMAAAGHPIRGDVKYGARRANPDRSIHLHAWQLKFPHPVSGETQLFTLPPPEDDPLWSAFTLPPLQEGN